MPAVSKKQQKFFGIVRAVQKGEMAPTTPETAKAAIDMKKSDVKKFASTKHKGLPEKKVTKEEQTYSQKDKILKKAKPLHRHLYKNLHKKDVSGDVNEQISYREFTKKAKESSEKVAKNRERQREINAMAAYKDKKTKGIKFYDKKGSGRIKAGKKVYD